MEHTCPAAHIGNLTNLLWLRTECQAAAERAQSLFAIDADSVQFYGSLSDLAIDTLCAEFDVSLFIPRFDSEGLSSALAKVVRVTPPPGRTELELHNLRNLQTLRQACLCSNGDAVWMYRINQETADAYRSLDHGSIVTLCKALTVCAFLPRYDAAEAARILDKPAGSRALFATAYETDIAAASEAARRSVYLTH